MDVRINVEIFNNATEGGTLTYHRTYTIPDLPFAQVSKITEPVLAVFDDLKIQGDAGYK